jgi:hypothetical protein
MNRAHTIQEIQRTTKEESRAFFALCMVSFALIGCVTTTPEQQATMEKDAAQKVTCTKGHDCEVKWGRAITWISQNSQWKIQTQNENTIQTETAAGGSPASHFLVNKVLRRNGVYEITMMSGCDNFIGCEPDATYLKASFNRFVVVGAPQPQY